MHVDQDQQTQKLQTPIAKSAVDPSMQVVKKAKEVKIDGQAFLLVCKVRT